jgi:amino-acid N-acetyltransferase
MVQGRTRNWLYILLFFIVFLEWLECFVLLASLKNGGNAGGGSSGARRARDVTIKPKVVLKAATIVSNGNSDYYAAYDSTVNGNEDRFHDELTSNDASYITILPKGCNIPIVSPPLLDNSTTLNLNNGYYKVDTTDSGFAAIFRQCAPYIAQHRGSVMVIHIPGHLHQNRAAFDSIMDDISILHLLGVQIVLVAGVRSQLDERLKSAGLTTTFHNSMRVTDDRIMSYLKEASGSVRFDIESSLARGFRGKPGNSGINVVSGNYFYSAKPLGVRDGIDFKFTGEVRKIEVENIKKRLEGGDVIMLTSLGYSPSGEVFNVPSESLAAECAANMKATKIIYLTDGESLLDNRSLKLVQSMRLAQAVNLLQKYGIANNNVYNKFESESRANDEKTMEKLSEECATTISSLSKQDGLLTPFKRRRKFATKKSMTNDTMIAANSTSLPFTTNSSVAEYVQLVARSVHALLGGVRRAHLVAAASGNLLKELYTRDGAGVLISRDVYEGIRQAQASDVRSVEEIIKPLEAEGILVPRSRDQLEKDMQDCFLVTRDGTTLACGMLKRYGDTHAEICCLAVNPAYRREGRGETLLAYLERRALLMGITQLFVLSTRTMQWFEERGFIASDPELLPPTRSYNATRGSKVYLKQLSTQRDVDAEELLWNM